MNLFKQEWNNLNTIHIEKYDMHKRKRPMNEFVNN